MSNLIVERPNLTLAKFQNIRPEVKIPGKDSTSLGQVNVYLSGEVENVFPPGERYQVVPEGTFYIEGISIDNQVTIRQTGKSHDIKDTLKQCSEILLMLGEEAVNLKVKQRQVRAEYVFFEVEPVKLPSNYQATLLLDVYNVAEEGQVSEEFYYYCTGSGKVDIQYFPYYITDYFQHEYNPVQNNAVDVRGSKYIVLVDRNMANVPVNYVTATRAGIPDSFYSSLSNTLGRYIGSRNFAGIGETYTGFKQGSTQRYLEGFKNLVRRSGSIDRVFYSMQYFSGSVYERDAVDVTVGSLQLSEIKQELLKFTPDSRYSVELVRGSVGEKVDGRDVGTEIAHIEVPKYTQLPGTGSVLYRIFNSGSGEYRIIRSKVYVPEMGKVLETDDYGVVVREYVE